MLYLESVPFPFSPSPKSLKILNIKLETSTNAIRHQDKTFTHEEKDLKKKKKEEPVTIQRYFENIKYSVRCMVKKISG